MRIQGLSDFATLSLAIAIGIWGVVGAWPSIISRGVKQAQSHLYCCYATIRRRLIIANGICSFSQPVDCLAIQECTHRNTSIYIHANDVDVGYTP